MENQVNNKSKPFNLYLCLYVTFFLFLLFIGSFVLHHPHDASYECNHGSTLEICVQVKP